MISDMHFAPSTIQKIYTTLDIYTVLIVFATTASIVCSMTLHIFKYIHCFQKDALYNFYVHMLRIEDMSFQEKDVQIKYPNIIIHV